MLNGLLWLSVWDLILCFSIPDSHDSLSGAEHEGHSLGSVPSHLGDWHKIITGQPLVFRLPCTDHAGIVTEFSGESLTKCNPGTGSGRVEGVAWACAPWQICEEKRGQGHICAVPSGNKQAA